MVLHFQPVNSFTLLMWPQSWFLLGDLPNPVFSFPPICVVLAPAQVVQDRQSQEWGRLSWAEGRPHKTQFSLKA